MRQQEFILRDGAGNPLTTVPTWVEYKDPDTGDDLDQPTVTNVAGHVRWVDEVDACGILDCGEEAEQLYYILDGEGFHTIAVFSAETGEPLEGLTLSWKDTLVYKFSDGTSYTPRPAFTELGGGLYRATWVTGEHVYGTVDCGPTARPRYFDYNNVGRVLPAVELVDPAEGTIDDDAEIVIDVFGDGIGSVVIRARHVEGGSIEHRPTVYDGSAFTEAFDTDSTVEEITGGLRFTIVRETKWTSNVLDVTVTVVGTNGQVTTETYEFEPDTQSAPFVENFDPVAGEISYLDPISFDVRDVAPGILRVLIRVNDENVYDGGVWGDNYQGATNDTDPITGGLTYTILRDGGWTEEELVIEIRAFDTLGNVTVLSTSAYEVTDIPEPPTDEPPVITILTDP